MSDSDYENAGLSEEELAALAEEDEQGEGLDDEEEDAGAEEAAAAEAAADEEAKKAAEEQDKAGEAEAAKAGEEGDPPDAATGEEGKDDAFIPQYRAEPVEDYDEKLSGYTKEKSDLRQQFQDGDLTLEEYEEKREAVSRQELDLREQRFKSEFAAEQNQQTAEQRWEWEQEQFFEAKGNDIYQDELLTAALDTAIKKLAADEANANKKPGWFLKEADRQVRERFKLGKTDETPKPNKRRREIDKTDIPPTLSSMPAAEQADPGAEDEFAHLDKLDGMELESELAKMSDEQQNRYLTGV